MLVVVVRLLSYLPLPALYILADILFVLLFHLLRYQRKLILENLSRAFPDSSRTAVRQMAARSYRNTIDLLFETVRAYRMQRDELHERVRLENPQQIDQLAKKYRTIIVAGAHQGNWEWLQLACSTQLQLPLAALYKPLDHKGLDAMLVKIRGRFGSTLIAAASSLPALLQFSRAPGVIALNADQGPRPDQEKYWSRFLNQDTAFFPGLEKLARLLDAPVVFVSTRRTRRGYYQVHFTVIAEQPRSLPDNTVMERYIRCVEKQVQAAPVDWLWLYKRWKYQRSVYD
jgi:KDO2-lipid IV(A) lauroyltransferase